MEMLYILGTGFAIFFARILDVSIGTIRTIVTVQGRMTEAFILGIIESTLWILVVSAVVYQIKETPVLIVFYALGFATGNVVGIAAEKKIALGTIILKVITNRKAEEITEAFNQNHLSVTRFQGEGAHGPVTELYSVCRRKALKKILPLIHSIDDEAFYVTEQAKDVSKILQPLATPVTGWRAVVKKK